MKSILSYECVDTGVSAWVSEAFMELGWHCIGLGCMIPGYDYGWVSLEGWVTRSSQNVNVA
jgi:hypothetical protein